MRAWPIVFIPTEGLASCSQTVSLFYLSHNLLDK